MALKGGEWVMEALRLGAGFHFRRDLFSHVEALSTMEHLCVATQPNVRFLMDALRHRLIAENNMYSVKAFLTKDAVKIEVPMWHF